MKNYKANKRNRRQFFSAAGKGIVGLILSSSIVGKLFGKSKKIESLKVVYPHPKAVKRVN